MTRRTKAEILKTVLEALKEKPLLITRVMHKAELNFQILKDLLEKNLIPRNFVAKQESAKGRTKYALTLDGLAALKKLRDAERTVNSVLEAS